MNLRAIDGRAAERIALGEGGQHVLVILGECGHQAIGTAVFEGLGVGLDAQVLHLRASVLHAQQEETCLDSSVKANKNYIG